MHLIRAQCKQSQRQVDDRTHHALVFFARARVTVRSVLRYIIEGSTSAGYFIGIGEYINGVYYMLSR